jgi:peptidoglycan/LPS O-acetylase OafA/YrhL
LLPTTHEQTKVRLDIQGLRAVAVLLVIGGHVGVPHLEGGYVGVDVFFVLSGYVVTRLLADEVRDAGKLRIGAFYARRVRRILPAASVVMVAVLWYAAWRTSFVTTDRTATDALWAAVLLANVRFARLETDYFAEGVPPSPLQHYWSLSVEEQFYLVWPLLIALTLVWFRHRMSRLDDVDPRPPLGPVAALAGVLCAASLLLSLVQTSQRPEAAYFSSPSRGWELGAGALLALYAGRFTRMPRLVRHMLVCGGLAAISGAAVGFDSTTPFPGFRALVPVVGSLAILTAGLDTDGIGAARILRLRPVTWIGNLSYSLYLWHWPVLVLWAESAGDERGPLETAALLATVLALSVLTYYLVEAPARRHSRWRSDRRALLIWPVVLAVTVAAVLGARAEAARRLENHLAASQRFGHLRELSVSAERELARSVSSDRRDSPIEYALHDLDDTKRLANDLWNHTYKCFADHDDVQARICPVGDVDAARTMMVVGDSHIGQWMPAFDALGSVAGYRVIPLIKLGCPPFDVDLAQPHSQAPYQTCSDFQDWVVDEIGRTRPEVVYAGARGMPRNMLDSPDHRQEAWTNGVHTFVAHVLPITSNLRLLSDVSLLQFDPIDCLTDVRSTMGRCASPESPRVLEANAIVRDVAADHGVPYVDLTSLACSGGICPAFAGGRMVYANDDHLSMDWVQHVQPDVLRRMPELDEQAHGKLREAP